ncbi:site-specific integrase [Shewanella sp. 202IG2-18]|uniref:site-specific integrase n=1 Tax=Parashewanella hymeniacidonis TaxID=2807618 RepID=UPI00196061FF|nr:site-specific integrase [Parashewanella hymeniacidonis]MBM7070920.1 site-specific integrase [Parashewanella hymeniacidonis]
MALPEFIETSKIKWIFKVIQKVNKFPEREKCLLVFFFASALTTLEINRIQIKDILHKNGSIRKRYEVKGEMARTAYISTRMRQDISPYLNWRVKNKVGLGDHPDHYLGLEPDDALFFTSQGKPFSIVRKKTTVGSDTYSCDALNRHIKKLLKDGGIESPSILSGRRTYAINLHRKGFDESHIHAMLGNKSVETTKKLLSTDPVDMSFIASQAF